MDKQTILSRQTLSVIVGILVLFGLYLISVQNYLLFHSLVELFSIVVACGIFMISWNSREFMENAYFQFLGITYLFVGVSDLLHILAYKGIMISQKSDMNLPTQLWISARYLESLSLLIAPYFFRKRLNITVIFAIYLTVFFLVVSAIFFQVFPDCYVEEVGLTAFKKQSEYVISLILVLAMITLLKKRNWLEVNVWQFMLSAIFLTIGSELAFTFYVNIYGFFNLIGHFLKLFSFYLVYKAIIETGLKRPCEMLFRNLKQSEERLRKERDKAKKYLDIAAMVVIVINAKKTVSFINKKGCDILGYHEDEIIGKNWFEHFITKSERDKINEIFIKLISGDVQATEYVENAVLTKSGEERIIAWHNTVVTNEDGKIIGTLSSGEDITDHKNRERELQFAIKEQKQHTFELNLLNQMGNLLQSCHNEQETYNVVIDVCKQIFPESSGYLCLIDNQQDIVKTVAFWGTNVSECKVFSVNDCIALCQNKIYDTTNSPCNEYLFSNMTFPPDTIQRCVPLRAPDGILGVLHIAFRPYIPDEYSDKFAEIIKSKEMMAARLAEQYALILANLRLRETLKMEAILDPLTGLYNRRYMEASLKREQSLAKRHNRPIGIIMLDVDHFKEFNDIHGHEAGDIVLRELGALLQRHVRGEDITCRYGGEEFVLILPGVSLEIAEIRAEELRIIVKEFGITYYDKSLAVTISIGVAVFPSHGPDLKDAMNTADAALYRAKNQGRDQVVVAPY